MAEQLIRSWNDACGALKRAAAGAASYDRQSEHFLRVVASTGSPVAL